VDKASRPYVVAEVMDALAVAARGVACIVPQRGVQPHQRLLRLARDAQLLTHVPHAATSPPTDHVIAHVLREGVRVWHGATED
jgi:hypothetical protein